MKQTNHIDIERSIYSLSVEDILTIIEEDELDVKLDEKTITFIGEKIGEFVDWRGAIEFAIVELKKQRSHKCP